MMDMQSLHFESSPRLTLWGHSGRTSQRVLATIALVALIVLSTCFGLRCWDVSQQIESLRSQSRELGASSVSLSKASPRSISSRAVLPNQANEIDANKLRGLNGVVRQLNIPWQDIFQKLEQLLPGDVALLTIEPDGQRSSVRIQAEAKDLQTLLSYAASLQQNEVFGGLQFNKYSTNDQDPNRPVRLFFELKLNNSHWAAVANHEAAMAPQPTSSQQLRPVEPRGKM